jgi:YD repeat-containing protein
VELDVHKGRLTTLTSPADTLQIDYDSLGRVAKQDRLIGTVSTAR